MAHEEKTHDKRFHILYYLDITFVVIFLSELILKMITFGFLPKASSKSRNWNKLIGDIYKRNWRQRCLNVWQLMCTYDPLTANAYLYKSDLGVYEITKSHDGLVIVHCVIPSVGLEIRILFKSNEWRCVYICRQNQEQEHGSEYPSMQYYDDKSETRASLSFLSDSSSKVEKKSRVSFSLADISVPVNRQINKRSQNADIQIRRWEKWNVAELSLHNNQEFMESRAFFDIDESVKQMLVSVSMNQKNTNAFCANGWNILDLIAVSFSVIALAFELELWSTLRALRLFRVVIRQRHMRSIFTSLGKGFPWIFSILLFSAFIYFILSVIGLNLFYDGFNMYVNSIAHVYDSLFVLQGAVVMIYWRALLRLKINAH